MGNIFTQNEQCDACDIEYFHNFDRLPDKDTNKALYKLVTVTDSVMRIDDIKQYWYKTRRDKRNKKWMLYYKACDNCYKSDSFVSKYMVHYPQGWKK